MGFVRASTTLRIALLGGLLNLAGCIDCDSLYYSDLPLQSDLSFDEQWTIQECDALGCDVVWTPACDSIFSGGDYYYADEGGTSGGGVGTQPPPSQCDQMLFDKAVFPSIGTVSICPKPGYAILEVKSTGLSSNVAIRSSNGCLRVESTNCMSGSVQNLQLDIVDVVTDSATCKQNTGAFQVPGCLSVSGSERDSFRRIP